MKPFSIFISYSHADEWLKTEFISHLAALKKNGAIDVWHDRMIPPGSILDKAIDQKIKSSDIFIFLISSDFINSDYCIYKEYEIAKGRHQQGEAEIIPVLVRDCDWDVAGLKDFSALPTDAKPVTRGAGSKGDASLRDAAWLDVIEGLKKAIAHLKKKLSPPSLLETYIEKLFTVDFIRHPEVEVFDERKIFIDPDIYYENQKLQINSFEEFATLSLGGKASIVTGGDRSGKSLLAKKLQYYSDSSGDPAILVKGRSIKNADIAQIIFAAISKQYGETEYPSRFFNIIVDDFDECVLNDRIKEQIINDLVDKYRNIVILSYSSAPSVLFTADDLPNPSIYKINPLTDDKLLSLTGKWKSIGLPAGAIADDRDVLTAFDRLQLIFDQSEIEKSAYSAVTFLELMESALGSDLAVASFASCYDTLVTTRLQHAGTDWRSFDEAKNFLSQLAYAAFIETQTKEVSRTSFENGLAHFEEKYLSSAESLKKMAFSSFLVSEDDGTISFREEYLWYFFCARHVAKELVNVDEKSYNEFVKMCSNNIFQKKFANIIIFIAYFSDDNKAISCLTTTIESLFSKAENWLLSDDTRELMLGIVPDEPLAIAAQSDVNHNRAALLKEKVSDIIGSAEKLVAQYTLPFLKANIGDSELIEVIGPNEIDADSYLRSVNALLRIHSVLGQILSTRAGTYDAKVVLECITKMVQASGRYASLNHAIATVLIYGGDETRTEIEKVYETEQMTFEEKFRKVTRIFAFWSVYLSQAGLARYLSNSHSIRALDILVKQYENVENERKNVPFNFTSVAVIARLYSTGKISRSEIERCIEKYGDESGLMGLLRVAIHIYTYYMPLEIEDKQWLAAKLGMPVRNMEIQRFKTSKMGRDIISKTRLLPS